MKDPLSKWEDRLEAQSEQESLSARLFHWFMIGLALSIVFIISGGLIFLAINRRKSFALNATPMDGLIVFCMGGIAGVALTLYYYHRKKRHVI